MVSDVAGGCARAFRSGRGCPVARARARRTDGGDHHLLCDRLGAGAGQEARRGGPSARARRTPAADAANGRAGDVYRRGGGRFGGVATAGAHPRLRLFVGHARRRRRRRTDHGHRPDRRQVGPGRVDEVRRPDHRRECARHHGRRVERALHPDRRRRHHRAGPGVVDPSHAGADGGDRQRDEFRRRA